MTKSRPTDARSDNEVLRRHRDILTDLARLASMPTTSREEFFVEITRRVADAIEIDHVKLMRFRRERGDLFLEAGVGWRPGLVKSVAFPADMSSHAGRAYQTGLPVAVDDLTATAFRVDPSLREHGIASVLNVPIAVDNATWGVLEADSTVRRSFSDDTIEFMNSAAALVGLVIHRTRIEEAHAEALAEQAQEVQRRHLLLSEMQHRVKNNFQMILAMIHLQGRNAQSESSREVMRKLGDNVMAMALAHNQLSPTQPNQLIDLATYLSALTANIEKPIEGVLLEIEANEMQVGIDQAVPIGLIVNEAVTNAVKHAFKDGGGKIHVELMNHGHGEALLRVTDNGAGMSEPPKSGSSGQKLMSSLARQIRGRIELETPPGGGTVVRVTFPRPPTGL